MFRAELGTPPSPIMVESGIDHPQRARGLAHHQTQSWSGLVLATLEAPGAWHNVQTQHGRGGTRGRQTVARTL
jgi:hypothetical protein